MNFGAESFTLKKGFGMVLTFTTKLLHDSTNKNEKMMITAGSKQEEVCLRRGGWTALMVRAAKGESLPDGGFIRSPLIVGQSHNSYWIGLMSIHNHSYFLICFRLFN